MTKRKSQYVEPIAKIIQSCQSGEISFVVLELDKCVSEPLAPAGLYSTSNISEERFQLHKFIQKEKNQYHFETYQSAMSLPSPGGIYWFRAWWDRETVKAALDITIVWNREYYPDNGDHDHCLFTWERIAAHSENRIGYHSRYGWITVEAYNKIIRDDIYRLRK
jgi:hypothetical protein